MTFWWQAVILLCSMLNLADSLSQNQVPQSSKYSNSFRLTRFTRTRVQQLLEIYKEQHLGNTHFEDRSRQLKDLPVLSTDFQSWLSLTDWERLHGAFWDLHIYWNMLEWKRKQLEKEKGRTLLRAVRATSLSPHCIKNIQHDLRDLISQVSSQMSYMKSSWTKPTSPTAWSPRNAEASSKTVWDRRVEGYIILRDLELYLSKLARDFLLLASKTPL